MFDDDPQLQPLLARVREGDEQAARELLDRYEPHVRRVVRRRLPRALRRKFDSIDFVQSVWGDFFGRLYQREIDFDNPRQLGRFLALVAQAKVINECRRRFRTEKFDLNREVAHDFSVYTTPVFSPDPSPSQTAAAHDRLDLILRGRPERHQRVLRLRALGFTFAEIAEQTGIDERSARRILEAVEKELGLRDAGK